MKTKEETLIFMKKWKEILSNNKASFDEVLNTGEDDFLSALIDAAPTVIEAYEDYGRGEADMQTEFYNIFYREDCYDYLVGRYFKHEDALKLSEQIQKGRYGFYEHSIIHQLLVGVEFCEWAKGVRYLPSRQKIFDAFKGEKDMKTRNTVDGDCLENKYKEAIQKPSTFYSNTFINWNGNVKETDTPASNVIARKLLDLIGTDTTQFYISEIPQNEKSYYVKNHTGYPTTNKNSERRAEELTAMLMFRKTDYPNSNIDGFIDYQTPLCRNSKINTERKAGKIDLLAINNEEKTVTIMELKKYESNETLLRCVLEAYTYHQQVVREKLLKDFSNQQLHNKLKTDDLTGYELKAAVIVFNEQLQHLQYQSTKYKNVVLLMEKLDIGLYVIHGTNKDIERIEKIR